MFFLSISIIIKCNYDMKISSFFTVLKQEHHYII